MLLILKGKEPEDYSAWARKVSESSGLGLEMMLSICWSADGGTDWVIKGIVGVPRFPDDDMKRHIAATRLAEKVTAPDFALQLLPFPSAEPPLDFPH